MHFFIIFWWNMIEKDTEFQLEIVSLENDPYRTDTIFSGGNIPFFGMQLLSSVKVLEQKHMDTSKMHTHAHTISILT